MAYVQLTKLHFYIFQVPRNLDYIKVDIEKVKSSRSSTNLQKFNFLHELRNQKRNWISVLRNIFEKLAEGWYHQYFRLEKSDGFRILSTIFWSSTRMTQKLKPHLITFAALFFISVSNLRHWTEPLVGFQFRIVHNSN